MLMAEEFQRCEKCGQGYFEEKVFVLIRKGSPKHAPDAYEKETQYHCIGCGHIQYKHKGTPES